MADADSILDPHELARARALLAEPRRRQAGMGGALLAALFVAVSALALAVAMVVAPPTVTTPIPTERS